MTLVEQIQQHLLQLPPEKQSEVLDFVVFLHQRTPYPQKRAKMRQALQSSLERLAGLGVFADIPDPRTWQQQIRQHRPLPGRES
jgi:hypothetical protein